MQVSEDIVGISTEFCFNVEVKDGKLQEEEQLRWLLSETFPATTAGNDSEGCAGFATTTSFLPSKLQGGTRRIIEVKIRTYQLLQL